MFYFILFKKGLWLDPYQRTANTSFEKPTLIYHTNSSHLYHVNSKKHSIYLLNDMKMRIILKSNMYFELISNMASPGIYFFEVQQLNSIFILFLKDTSCCINSNSVRILSKKNSHISIKFNTYSEH